MQPNVNYEIPDHNVEWLTATIIDDIQHNALDLPTLPQIALKVIEVVESEDSNAEEIAKLVAMDPALSARLLRVANSSIYRGSVPIEHLLSAVARLGSRLVRNLVSALVVLHVFRTKSPAFKARMQRLWAHSIEVAATSQVLARRCTGLDPEEALLAGLLHDIGALPILSRAARLPELANAQQAVEQVITTLHTSIGKRILRAWNFRPELIAVAAEHENLERDSANIDYVDIVTVADLYSDAVRADREVTVDWSHVAAFNKLGYTAEKFVAVMQEAASEIAEVKSILGT